MAAILMAACNEADCISKTTNFVNIKFYKISTFETDTLAIDSVTALNPDTLLLANAEVTSLRLPLQYTGSTIFVINSDIGNDTIILNYRVRARLVSEDCGVETIFSDLKFERNDYDSAKVVNNILIEDITEDVKIFN